LPARRRCSTRTTLDCGVDVLDVLVCVKRVPMPGATLSLTEDERGIDTKFLGFTVSPHEECAVEEAVRITTAEGGRSVVLTLGPEEAIEQLRDAVSIGMQEAVLLATDGEEWGPQATSAAIAATIEAERDAGRGFDLMLFGNEAADTGDYQVPIRVAHRLGVPVATGIKSLTVDGDSVLATREYNGAVETYRLPLPCVVSVREGINLPRYPSLPGRIKAKKAQIDRGEPLGADDGLKVQRLQVPEGVRRTTEVLGTGADAAPRVVEVLEKLGLVGG
jgi:electron transfer flavoprotein beta subunit